MSGWNERCRFFCAILVIFLLITYFSILYSEQKFIILLNNKLLNIKVLLKLEFREQVFSKTLFFFFFLMIYNELSFVINR